MSHASIRRPPVALAGLFCVLAACSGRSISPSPDGDSGGDSSVHDETGGTAGSSASHAGTGANVGVGGAPPVPADNLSNYACRLEQGCAPTGERPAELPRPSCPETLPDIGGACDLEGLDCSYGDSLTSYCREYRVCTNRTWKTHPSRAGRCQSHPPEFCPEMPQDGASCITGSIDSVIPCEYSGSIACYCLGSPPNTEGAEGFWECYAPPRNGECPEVLPNVGDGCSINGKTCHYGIPAQGCGAPYVEVFCYQGAWEGLAGTCFL